VPPQIITRSLIRVHALVDGFMADLKATIQFNPLRHLLWAKVLTYQSPHFYPGIQ